MILIKGFESSTYAINECKNPARNVPLSMIISLSLISFVYCGSSFALNMMQPFDEFDLHASYPTAFKNVPFMYWLCSIGPIISLTGTLLISIFTIARTAYAMAVDGLFFKVLANVNKKTEIPDYATVTSLVFSVILVVLIDIQSLIGIKWRFFKCDIILILKIN